MNPSKESESRPRGTASSETRLPRGVRLLLLTGIIVTYVVSILFLFIFGALHHLLGTDTSATDAARIEHQQTTALVSFGICMVYIYMTCTFRCCSRRRKKKQSSWGSCICRNRFTRKLARLYEKWFGDYGLLGIHGDWLELDIILREIGKH